MVTWRPPRIPLFAVLDYVTTHVVDSAKLLGEIQTPTVYGSVDGAPRCRGWHLDRVMRRPSLAEYALLRLKLGTRCCLIASVRRSSTAGRQPCQA